MSSSKTIKVLTLSKYYPRDNGFIPENQSNIYACMDPPVEAVEAGKAIALPHGKFKIDLILKQLPSGWWPDLVSISSTLMLVQNPPIPVGITSLTCPSVMKLIDSHHMPRPIQNLIEYAKLVGCQYHWTGYTRHHIHFFVEAGLPNVFWMPGAISIPPYVPEPVTDKTYDVIFRGAVDSNHYHRREFLKFLQEAEINVDFSGSPYAECLDIYVQSKIVLNCSLNGDLNRRVYEVLMVGGFLLTDRLALQSGLPLLFQEGVHLECYGSKQELLDKIKYYLSHPDEAAEIARKGHELFMAKYHPEILVDRFNQIVFNGENIPPIFSAQDDVRVTSIASRKINETAFYSRLKIYELLQELHRVNFEIDLLYYQSKNELLVADLSDLPKFQITLVNSPQELANITEDFEVIIIDLPKEVSHIEPLIEQLNPCIFGCSLFLVLGNSSSAKQKKLNSLLKPKGLVPTQFVEREASTYLAYQRQVEETKTLSRTKKLNLELFCYSDIEDYNNPLNNRSSSIKQVVKNLVRTISLKNF
ncbi:MAG: hypothetical protein N4J56_003298 [Chroococcidiopsis sp. SAG 2025]|uniref:glycosyltransferase n=1 Tax=Chroococcidiopsis sp. SAG 2025 TaxID=171389 RepID=UPI002936E1C7|nr:glycosyltransferase [Chroococcidiopsis sp. SAG 2025]MDV2993644.1 hypothetical protein [Chroococcidiopsis sp. SAG 2025]